MGNVVAFNNDSLRSLVAGLGDPNRDKMASTYYGADILADDQLLEIYRSNWLGRKTVEIPAEDSVRKGRDWQAAPDQIELIEADEKRLGFWQKLKEAQIKARLWGGAAIYIGTNDSDPTEPLNFERVRKGGLRYLTVLSRREIIAGDLEQDALSPQYGKPKDYQVISNGATLAKIHPSRLAVFTGPAHADQWLAQGSTRGWGDSVLSVVYSAMKNADSSAANIASLIFEANVDVFGVPNFMQNLSDPAYEQKIINRFVLAAASKGINKALILDKEETYERKTVSFATLPEIMKSFLEQYCGASDIPMTRFLGTAPSGLGSNGDHSMKNYHDRLSSIQALEITPAIYMLDECLIRSALGSRPPEVWYQWSPLEQMSEKELADIGKSNAETAETLSRTGLFTSEELRTVVSNQMIENGFYPGLDQTMEETGEGFDLGNDDPEDDPVAANDAAPRTLYVRRDVLNADEIIAWAKSQGFKTTLPADDLHVTIAFSRMPVDWMAMGSTWDDEVKIPRGGARLMEKFGEARVLLFNSNMLKWRHEEMRREGASWDHDEYQPHITISYDPQSPDIASIEAYQGEIILGPEIFQEVKEDWKAGIKET
jgi:phage-related protein (TIGR01555 family)